MLHHTSDAFCPSCEDKLKQAHGELITWFRWAKGKYPTLHISWSHRDQQAQEEAYAQGRSHAHFPASPHNKLPSLALDIFQINDQGRAVWDSVFCAKLADETLKEKLPIIWGGHFKSLGDNDHFQVHDAI